MAGTLTISTLSDGTNSTSSTNCIQGSAKAWVQFNGSSGAIRASYNMSSVTRSATGLYTLNFTNALADGNYAVAGAGGDATTSAFVLKSVAYNAAPSTTSVAISMGNSAFSNTDATYSSVIILR
jgi:hypothetical protein